MFAYVLKSSDFCKIGVTNNVFVRKSQYKCEILDFFSIEIPNCNDIKCMFIESYVIEKSNSETEYIYYSDFDTIISILLEAMAKLPDKLFHMNIFNQDVYYNNDGYISINSIVEYVNSIRISKFKTAVRFDVYLKSLETQDFISQLENKFKRKAIIGKRGKFGGTCVLPHIILDFLIWSEVSLKINTYQFMFSDDYISFLSLMPEYKLKLKSVEISHNS